MIDFVIVVDTREQTPFLFESIDPFPVVVRDTLHTGDYSIVGHKDEITVERKGLSDLFGSCGKGRKRFEKEIIRMADFKYAAIVCEADWLAILRNPPVRSSPKLPKTVFASMIAWSQRYGVHFWPCVNRALAEKVTYRILDRFYRDCRDGFYEEI